jgi:putative ABC transport system ATP-binding protein
MDKVSLSFTKNNRPTIENISYEIHEKDFIILLGSNGSGKSTLLNVLQKHLRFYSGEITFLGKNLHHHDEKSFNDNVTILSQQTSNSLFSSLSIYENYLLMRKKHHYTKNDFKTYLQDFNPNLPEKIDLPVMLLSGGEKQSAALACRLLHPPKLLLLDEHTSALDPKTSKQIMLLTQKMITRHQITCILTTHDLDIALQYGNRILILSEGKVKNAIEQNSKKILSKEQLMNMYY